MNAHFKNSKLYFYLKIYKSENQPFFHSYVDSLESKLTHINYIHPVSALYNMLATISGYLKFNLVKVEKNEKYPFLYSSNPLSRVQ